MTRAYASISDQAWFKNYNPDQKVLYDAIVDCDSRARVDFNVPVVIPSGVAVQMARETRLNNENRVPADSKVYQLTRDGFHLSRQHGRYIAACVWFESLIKPTLGKSVKGNPYLLEDTEYSITKKDAKLCQKCAIKAVASYK